MRCPHCLENFHEEMETQDLGRDKEYDFTANTTMCPACGRAAIVLMRQVLAKIEGHVIATAEYRSDLIWPRAPARRPLGPEIPTTYANDFGEANAVLPLSPKASAAISRRVLQRILREVVGCKPGDLSREIDEVLERRTLPSDIAAEVDAIRQVGNFATHPMKSTNTGEVVDVEPGEAEWLLDVLSDLFDVLFVRPTEQAKRRAALNTKLAEVGKPPLKEPPQR